MERKLATVVFVDLVDSTGLVASADPEVVRRRVTRFFERVSHCIETYGGTVEKFAGDAVMAAFGIPQAHEDDAERAVRASLSLLDSIGDLGLQARVGIESGEVVADRTDSTFATGEAVNVAARLQQEAEAGQILLGPGTHRLTLGRVEAEDLGPVLLRGIERPIWTWAAIGVNGRGTRKSVEAPFVGREAERELLENTFGRAIRDRRAHLVTVYGEPGVGKTRLGQEFLGGLEGATVLAGRALPYGESITYWPLGEMVKASADIADDDPIDVAIEKLRDCCPAEAVADLLGLASGVLEAVHGERSQQEIAWAAREWAELMAAVQPLVLVFEDIHWAEEPLLELIEHLADWVRGAPLLILCFARPELLDVRPGWGGGRVRATAIELEPLAAVESEELVDALLDASVGPLDENVRRTVLEKTEGNPLFVEETVRMLAERGGTGADQIPDTVQALIAARIDQIVPEARTVLQRASVIGRTFWASAIQHLSSDIEDVECVLEDLLLRDFIVPGRSTLTGETAYRFKHVLIREVAYGGLAKSSRAEHHLRFADWLSERAGDELLEIRAYHLDHASALLAELDGAPPADLAARAAEVLEKAGRRALARESYRAARHLLLRAVELGPTLERRWFAARAAFRLGDFLAVQPEMERVRTAAADAGERKIHGRALTALAELVLYRDADAVRARELIDEALTVLEGVKKHPDTRFEAYAVSALISAWLGQLDDAERFYDKALKVAQESGRKDLETTAVESLANSYVMRLELDKAGPLVERALELAEESGSARARAQALEAVGSYRKVCDQLEEAEAAYTEALELNREMGYAPGLASTLDDLGRVAQVRGEYEEAERLYREAIRILKPLGERGRLCETQRKLAQVLVERGRLDEAERVALEARRTVGPDDAFSQLTTALALGVVKAAQGRDDDAEMLLRAAAEGLALTQFRAAEPEALRELIAFLNDRGRADEAAPFVKRLARLGGSAPAESAARIA